MEIDMVFKVSKDSKALCGIWYESGMERAAEWLSVYLTKITGADYQKLDERCGARFEIVFDKDVKNFRYGIKDDTFVIAAPDEVKAGWGVFYILEQLAGCLFCTSWYEHIPKDPDLTLETEEYVHNTAFEHNYVHYRDYMDHPIFAMKRGTFEMGYNDDEKNPLFGNGFAHSIFRLMDVDLYHTHPEYFCMRDGERLAPEYVMTLGGGSVIGNMQPCLSNPDVFEIVCENLKKQMEENPRALIWNVSQSDNFNYCQCPECAKVDEEEGSQLGSWLRFVNKVADRFPGKIISTLAYQYTRTPCKITKPRKNVMITLCNIEAYRDSPIKTDPANAQTKKELVEWRGLTDGMFYWDYCIQFENLVSPFPNFRTLAENMKFFAEGGISVMFSQGNREMLGEFAELRGYILQQLAEDPTRDLDAVIERFCRAYYKEAAPYVIEYIKIMHDALEASDYKLHIFDKIYLAKDSYLREELFNKYMELYDKAEAAVAYDAEILRHVRLARMPLYFAGVKLGYGTKAERYAMLSQFSKLSIENNVDMVWEIGRDTAMQFIRTSMAELAD